MEREATATTVDQVAHQLLRIADAVRDLSRPPLSHDELSLLDVSLAVLDGAMDELRADELQGALRIILRA